MSSIVPRVPTVGKGKASKILQTVIRIVQGIWSIISGRSKDGGGVDSIQADSSLENIDKITEIFSDFKEQVHSRAIEIENGFADEAGFYLDEIKQMLIDHQDVGEKYGIRIERIERKLDRILPRMSGVIDHELSKRVSLDDTECRNIMKMIPGEKKENALKDFLNKSIGQAINICCENFKSNLDEIFEEVTDEIIGAVESIQKTSEAQLTKMKEVDADNYAEKAKKLISDAYYCIDVCSLTDKIIAEA